MKRILLISCIVLCIGCVHYSKTITDFNGKTTGINPYGSGTIKVHRESYWGMGKVEQSTNAEINAEIISNANPYTRRSM